MTLPQDDFRTYIRQVLASPLPPLPEHEFKIGSVTAEWFELVDEPNTAVIITTGGSAYDRHWTEFHLVDQLKAHGYRQASIDMEGEGLRRHGSWSDVMAKSKRLIQSGNVTVLRNGWTNVVGFVIGDHGEYETEFSREDPETGVVTQWSCTCAWAQYAWDRTRAWKKYEGRVCAHALALYWKARSTPLDEDDNHPSGQAPPGQTPMAPGADSGGAPRPGPVAPPEGYVPAPAGADEGAPPPPDQSAPAPAPPPSSPGVIPPFPGADQMAAEQWQGPGTTPGGGVSPPNAVSVPGAKPPSPFNPLQSPGGTYSRVAAQGDLTPGSRVVLQADEYGVKEGREGATDAGEWTTVPKGTAGEVFDYDEPTGLVCVLFELNGGPMTSYHVRCYCDAKVLKAVKGRSPLDPGQVPRVPFR